MNLPNKLTVIRIILVPIMVLFAYIPIGGDVLGIPVPMLIMETIFIIASIIMGINISFTRTTLFDFVIMIVLMGSGAGLLLRSFFAK